MVSVRDLEPENGRWLSMDQAVELISNPERVNSVAEVVSSLAPEDRVKVLEGVDVEKLQYDWEGFWARPAQIIPDEPYSNVHCLVAGRGFGKGLSVSEPILTTSGWKTMGDLVAGDEVYDEKGVPCTVVRAFEPYWTDDMYEIQFSDGTSMYADGPHQWVTWTTAEMTYMRSRKGEEIPDDWAVNYRSWRDDTLTVSEIEKVNEMSAAGYDNIQIASMFINPRTGKTRDRHLIGRVLKGTYRGIHKQVKTTEEIANTQVLKNGLNNNHYIPNTKPVQFSNSKSKSELPIDPWLFGLLLGDADTLTGSILAYDPRDGDYLRNRLAKMRLQIPYEYDDHHMSLTRNGLVQAWKKMGLHKGKYIPDEYLYASVEDRMALVQGLNDSDGCVSKDHGVVTFTNTNKSLIDGYLFLLNSLGITGYVYGSEKNRYGKNTKYCWQVNAMSAEPLVSLPRKIALLKNPIRRKAVGRFITRVEKKTETTLVRCIEVDSPNHMYLVGKHLLPSHNSRLASEWLRKKAMEKPNGSMIVLGRTAQDVRDVMVTGPSGLLNIPQPEDEKPIFKVNETKVVYPNGSTVLMRSAERPDGLRGVQASASVADEMAAYTPYVGVDNLTAFDNLRIATRLGDRPQVLVTTTPKRVKALRDLLEEAEEKGPKYVRVVRGSTLDNASNLADVYLDVLVGANEGTKLYDQEILGLMLDDDMEGVLWMPDDIHIFPMDDSAKMRFGVRVVGVDPSVAENPTDLCGIVVAGMMPGPQPHKRKAYILEDASIKASPEVWARKVVETAHKWNAHGVVVEKNQGDHLVTMALKAIDPTLRIFPVHAGLSKLQRAEPVAIRYKQNKVIHTESFPELESELTTWQPAVTKKSPDRLDALVWAVHALLLNPPKGLLRNPVSFVPPRGGLPIGGLGTGAARSWGGSR